MMLCNITNCRTIGLDKLRALIDVRAIGIFNKKCSTADGG
jgi:hypothetical protein